MGFYLFAFNLIGQRSFFRNPLNSCQWLYQVVTQYLQTTGSGISELGKRRRVGSSGMSVSYIAPRNKIDNNRIETTEKKEDFFLLISTIDQQENLKILLKAFSSKKLKAYKLIVVAKEKSKSFNLSEWIISTNVTLINSFDEELVNYLFKKANVFINCSFSDVYKSGIIEAINNDCYLLLSDIPVFKMIANEKVTYFDPLSESSIINAVISTSKR